MDIISALSVIVAALGVLVADIWLYRSYRRRIEEVENRLLDLRHAPRPALETALAAYKLEVAKSYASVGLVKDVERRLTEHLARIEAKIGGAS